MCPGDETLEEVRSGNIQGAFKEHSVTIQGTFRDPDNVPSGSHPLEEVRSENIQGPFREHSGTIQGIFRDHSGNSQRPR
jgi:hypothetical protein